MPTTKGLTFVLALAIGPPAIWALLNVSGLQTWRSLFRPIWLLVLVPWLWAIWNITIPYLTSPLKDIPYPPHAQESFFGGHVAAVNEMPRGDNLRKWIDTIPNSGFIQWRGPFHGFPTVMLTTIEGLQEALIGHPYDFEKVALDRIFLEKFLGRGLIVVEGSEHKFQRKHLQPAFAGSQIKGLIPLFWSKSGEFVEVLANELHGTGNAVEKKSGVLEIDAFASRVTIDIIGMACLGRDLNAIHNSGDKIVEQYDKILTPTDGSKLLMLLGTILLPLQVARRLPPLSPILRDVRDAADGRHNLRILCRQLMETKRRDMETQNEKHIDIISTLIRSGNFNDDQLVDQILTFLAAG
jgi:cytochrome P450